MPLSSSEAETLARNAVAALEAGRAAEARPLLERLAAAGGKTTPYRLMLAFACRTLGDAPAEAAVLDELLAAEPGNLHALVMRGDAFRAAGDLRAATSFYRAALTGAKQAGPLPPGLNADLQRIEAFLRDATGRYEAWLEEQVAPASVSPRFAEAFDIMLGRREIFFQQPSVFYFPGLPQIQYYEREQFPWAERLEAATGDIKAELAALLDVGASFRPYVEADKDRPFRDFHGMHGDPSWGAYHLWKDGALVEENAAACPKTMAAMADVPLSRIGNRTPSVLFSLLRPGAHIPPHYGMLNCRLICHLPLIVPGDCWLRVGNERRAWEEGKLLIFDDSIQHEAKNGSDALRVVLLFDIWRPELSEAERRGTAAAFEAIDGFQAGAAAQQDA